MPAACSVVSYGIDHTHDGIDPDILFLLNTTANTSRRPFGNLMSQVAALFAPSNTNTDKFDAEHSVSGMVP